MATKPFTVQRVARTLTFSAIVTGHGLLCLWQFDPHIGVLLAQIRHENYMTLLRTQALRYAGATAEQQRFSDQLTRDREYARSHPWASRMQAEESYKHAEQSSSIIGSLHGYDSVRVIQDLARKESAK